VPAPAARLSVVRAVGWLFVFGLLGLAFTTAGYVGASYLFFGDRSLLVVDPTHPSAAATFTSGLASALGFALATWIVAVRKFGFTWRDLRWTGPHRGSGVVLGLLLGATAAGTALLLAVPFGGAAWTSDTGSFGTYLGTVARTAAVLAPAALSEEIIFRGFPLVLLAGLIRRWPALIALSVAFALAHVVNPNTTVPGIANIAFAGIFLSLAFYAPGGLWTAFGAHIGWNATLAALDAPVSGLPFAMPFLNYDPGGPAWVTGGRFGPEGGLTATVAIALASFAAWRWAGKDAT
jgi:membrane protease YdiL (CAAX protease family)